MTPVRREAAAASTTSGPDSASPAAGIPLPGAVAATVVGPAAVGQLWLLAAIAGGVGAWMTFDAQPGVNWTIWTVVAASGLALTTRRARGRVPREIALLLLLACTLSGGAAITADPVFQFLTFAGVATLLALATLIAGGARLEQAGLLFLLLAPLFASIRTGVEAIRRVFEGAGMIGRNGGASVLRGALIALPVVAGLALLLSQADPVLAVVRDDVARAIAGWTFLPRLFFLVIIGGMMLGACGLALHPGPEGSPVTISGTAVTLRLGDTERLIVLGSVAALFALFVLLQFAYFFGDLAGRPGTGITYAEYARRGFGELTLAASLATGLIVGLDLVAARGTRERAVRIVSLVLIGLVQLLLDSAYHRVSLYEQAYGYTTARVYAQVYMVAVSLSLALLTFEVCTTLHVKRLVRRVALLATCALIALVYWNHQAWIVRRNVARYAAADSVSRPDLAVAATAEPLNAIPALVESLPRLDPVTRAGVRACLLKRATDRAVLHMREAHWYEWNRARRNAARALLGLQRAQQDAMTPAPGMCAAK